MKKIIFRTFLIIIIFCVIIYLDARYINTSFLKVNEVAIYSPNLNSDYNGFKIAQFSDLLYGSTINEKNLEKIVNELNNLNADIIIFTGDLSSTSSIDSKTKELLTNYLSQIEAKMYKFAIIGDNDKDYLDEYLEILEDSNFNLLHNSNTLIYKNSSTPINIIGLTSTDDITELYDNDYFNITLIHYPDLINNIPKSDLVFAGHSLGGQIRLPLIGGLIKKEGASTYIESYYKIKDMQIFISNGLGTTNLKLRLFNTPSITLYRLYNE